MLLYSYNLALFFATAISWILVVVGREFQFPINFCTDNNRIFTSNPAILTDYEAYQSRLISCTHAIARKIIHNRRVFNCEYINSFCPKPHLFPEGDMVFPKHAVKSEKSSGLVGKLMN